MILGLHSLLVHCLLVHSLVVRYPEECIELSVELKLYKLAIVEDLWQVRLSNQPHHCA